MTTITLLEFFQALYPEPLRPGRLVLWSKKRRSGRKHTDWCHKFQLKSPIRLFQVKTRLRPMLS